MPNTNQAGMSRYLIELRGNTESRRCYCGTAQRWTAVSARWMRFPTEASATRLAARLKLDAPEDAASIRVIYEAGAIWK